MATVTIKHPQWIKRTMPVREVEHMNRLLREYGLHTVCQSAHCPNVGECFKEREATFLILGNVCTRNCSFCSVKKGSALAIDINEPERIAKAILELALKYVVITSVTRDDLPDGGAGQFVDTVKAIRDCNEGIKIEILTPDFSNNISALDKIILAKPDCFTHNIETVARLYGKIRPKADYKVSLSILNYVKNNSPIITKSGIMVGLGETQEEVFSAITDLRRANCDILTIGQYLKASKTCIDVADFIEPAKFADYEIFAKGLKFASVVSSPFVRSSYKAKQSYREAISNGSRPSYTRVGQRKEERDGRNNA